MLLVGLVLVAVVASSAGARATDVVVTLPPGASDAAKSRPVELPANASLAIGGSIKDAFGTNPGDPSCEIDAFYMVCGTQDPARRSGF